MLSETEALEINTHQVEWDQLLFSLGASTREGSLYLSKKKKKKTREESLQMRSTDSLLAALIYQSLPVGDKEPSLRFPLR